MKKFIEQIKTTKCFTGKNGQFTTHYSLFTKNLVPQCLRAFTLAETLIVIGIIGVVAALTLPNLNHATGDKEKVTRVKKAYSMLSEANDRAVATYGPISEWSETCKKNLSLCWMSRISEFLKISKFEKYDEVDEESSMHFGVYYLQDGMTILAQGWGNIPNCNASLTEYPTIDDFCLDWIVIDLDGPNKGKNADGNDYFAFVVSDTVGVLPFKFSDDVCIKYKDLECTYWVLEYGNLDYLKADEEGNCNDSNIVLDGVNNTSCH